jgi:toxin-antitoxin system PIN domain toxin
MSVVIVDVNILVAAFASGHAFHDAARKWLTEALDSGGVGAPDVVWSGFMRIVTNPRIVAPAASWSEVRAFMDAVRYHRGYLNDIRGMKTPLQIFEVLCQSTGTLSGQVSDAYIAQVAIDHNAAVATWDKDFAAYPVPLVQPPLG